MQSRAHQAAYEVSNGVGVLKATFEPVLTTADRTAGRVLWVPRLRR